MGCQKLRRMDGLLELMRTFVDMVQLYDSVGLLVFRQILFYYLSKTVHLYDIFCPNYVRSVLYWNVLYWKFLQLVKCSVELKVQVWNQLKMLFVYTLAR